MKKIALTTCLDSPAYHRYDDDISYEKRLRFNGYIWDIFCYHRKGITLERKDGNKRIKQFLYFGEFSIIQPPSVKPTEEEKTTMIEARE